MKREDLVNNIINLFPDFPIKAIDVLIEKKGWEYEDIRKNISNSSDCFVYKYKTDVLCLGEMLEWHADSLAGFTPEGFHYIIKYYLLYSIYDPSSDVADYVVFHLSEINKNNKYWSVRYKQFSDDEKNLISKFLKYMESQEEFVRYIDVIERGIDIWSRGDG